MLIAVFKSNQKVINAFIVLLTFVMWVPRLWNDTVVISYDNSLFNLVEGLNKYSYLSYIVCVLLVSFQAIYLNNIVNRHKIVKNNSHLVGLFYVILMGVSKTMLIFNPLLLVNTLVIILLHLFLRLYNQAQVNEIAFNLGVLIGLATLIYFPLIILFPFLWLVLLYMSTPNWRSFIVSIFGFVLPLLYYVVGFFFSDNIETLKASFGLNNVIFFEQASGLTNYYYSICVALALGILSILYFIKSTQFDVVKVRKSKLLTLMLAVLLSLLIILNGNDYLATLSLVSVPFSIFLANYFNDVKRKWLAEFLFTVLAASLVLNYVS